MTNPVKFFRLRNGDDIVAEVSSDNKLNFEFKNPMKVVIDVNIEMNSQHIVMFNWMPQGICKSNSCFISRRDVLFSTDVETDIEDHYKAVVFDLVTDQALLKSEKPKKEYIDKDKKVIAFNKNSKDIN